MEKEWIELAGYLGDNHRPEWVQGPEHIKTRVVENKGEDYYLKNAVERLYIETREGLSHLWEPFYKYLSDTAPTPPRGRGEPLPVLLWHDPIGAVGLRLEERGYEPHFVAESGVCKDYLKWRIKTRGWDSKVYGSRSKIPQYPVLAYRGPLGGMPDLDKAVKMAGALALGIGPLAPHEVAAFAANERVYVAEKYRLLRWEVFNVRWCFLAFREPPRPVAAAVEEELAEETEEEMDE